MRDSAGNGVLFAWLGVTDLKASRGEAEGVGAIATAVEAGRYRELVLLCTQSLAEVTAYVDWLRSRASVHVVVEMCPLDNPTDLRGILDHAVRVIETHRGRLGPAAAFAFHTTPGTPQMQAVLMLLGKTRYPAELVQTSRQRGFEKVDFPFEISIEFLPVALRPDKGSLEEFAASLPPSSAPVLARIVHDCSEMRKAVALARRIGAFDVSALVLGESGVGKDLFAELIHQESPRRSKPYRVVNCGAIPKELAESELFGHEVGAFTGAKAPKAGIFEEADGGTVFLDEIGDLPLELQVKLLRVLQNGTVRRVGANAERPINVRVIAATNRSLEEEVAARRFREDLLFRLAVGVVRLPALRDRGDDVRLLAEHFLATINEKWSGTTGFTTKRFRPAAMEEIRRHRWPGNVRELWNTLLRTAMFVPGAEIRDTDIRSMLSTGRGASPSGGHAPRLGDGFDLRRELAQFEVGVLEQALAAANGVKAHAASLVGLLPQTFDNRLRAAQKRTGRGT